MFLLAPGDCLHGRGDGQPALILGWPRGVTPDTSRLRPVSATTQAAAALLFLQAPWLTLATSALHSIAHVNNGPVRSMLSHQRAAFLCGLGKLEEVFTAFCCFFSFLCRKYLLSLDAELREYIYGFYCHWQCYSVSVYVLGW